LIWFSTRSNNVKIAGNVLFFSIKGYFFRFLIKKEHGLDGLNTDWTDLDEKKSALSVEIY
jgi:hypothetical protein